MVTACPGIEKELDVCLKKIHANTRIDTGCDWPRAVAGIRHQKMDTRTAAGEYVSNGKTE